MRYYCFTCETKKNIVSAERQAKLYRRTINKLLSTDDSFVEQNVSSRAMDREFSEKRVDEFIKNYYYRYIVGTEIN